MKKKGAERTYSLPSALLSGSRSSSGRRAARSRGARAEDALQGLLSRVSENPSRPELHVELGNLYHADGRLTEAIAAFERAVALAPDRGSYVAFLARAKWQAQRRDALQDLDLAVKLDPKVGWIRCWRGEFLRRQGRLKEALADLDRGLRLMPAYSRAYAWRGALKAAQGRYGAALLDLDRGIDEGSFQTLPLAERAHVKLRLKDWTGAINDMNRAVRLDPGYSWSKGAVERDGEKFSRKCESVLADLDAASRALKSPWPSAWRGEIFLRLKRYPEALSELDRALGMDPACAWAYAWRGEARRRLQDWTAAASDLDRAAGLDSDYYFTFGWRGLLRMDRGDFPRALKDLNLAVRGNDRLIKTHGAVSGKEGDSSFMPPRLASPASWVIGARGRALFHLGRFDAAARDLRRAVDIDDRNVEASLLLARAYRELGRGAEALEFLRRTRAGGREALGAA